MTHAAVWLLLSVTRYAPVSYTHLDVYKRQIYINPPSVRVGGPLAPNLSNFRFESGTNGSCTLVAPGVTSGDFAFTADAEGTYNLVCDLNQDGVFDLSDADDLLIHGSTVVGQNTVAWDGTDRDGNAINSDVYDCRVLVAVGEVHFIGEDVETSSPCLLYTSRCV